jgi:hypothetical protein
MAKKLEFDWKNFLLQKGEKLGLGVGLAIMAVMLVFGIKGIFSGSPTANAEVLNKKTQNAKQLLVNNQPRDRSAFEVPQDLLAGTSTLDPVSPETNRLDTALFVPFAIDDNKRREPKIAQPTEMVGRYAEVQAKSYMFDQEKKKVMVLRGENVKAQDQQSLKSAQGRLSGMMGAMRGGMMMGGGGPSGGGPGMGMRGGMMGNPLMQGMGMMGGRPGMGGPGRGMQNLMMGGQGTEGGIASSEKNEKDKKKNGYVDIQELSKQNDVRLADLVLPLRMVIWEGAFPLKKQLEDMKSALHTATLGEAFAQLRFAGFEVQRREIGPDGKPASEWADFDFENAIRLVLRLTGKRYAEEDPSIRPIILRGLVYNLPEQFEERKYPSAAEKIKELEKTLAWIKEKGQTVEQIEENAQFNVGQDDLFDTGESQNRGQPGASEGVGIGNPAGIKGGVKPGGAAGGAGGGLGKQGSPTPKTTGKGAMIEDSVSGTGATAGKGLDANWEPPEYCLVRFYDVNVDPGKTYQYRFKVKIKNPNEGHENEVAYKKLAQDKYVLSKNWIELPQHISIPPDFHYYAVDQKELESKRYVAPRDQAVVQLQRWVDFFNAADKKDPQPVGDWAVAERVVFSRGEFIGGTHKIELPVWNWLDEHFVIASDPADRTRSRTKLVSVRFTDSDSQCPVLVDFSGGTVSYHKPEEKRPVEDKDLPHEVLLLSPEGRLLVRNSVIDAEDAGREEHLKSWRQRIKDIKDSKDKEKKDGMKPGEASPFNKGTGGKQ